ncbi:hypothetical protein BOX15_Mlig030790g1 [Macrostomum lignano]|uniref:Uncharacterized protein n=1 Tax=Macrostomum lignano TaxID=282301 RepID=A0A267GRM7_9PLAT|nr:hypothetical protein BOX15_Mlig030790g1 [Macrostomum lignano]
MRALCNRRSLICSQRDRGGTCFRLSIKLPFLSGLCVGAVVTFALFSLHNNNRAIMSNSYDQKPLRKHANTIYSSSSAAKIGLPKKRQRYEFYENYKELFRSMDESMYRFDSQGVLLPLMRLSKDEENWAYRAAAGRAWIRSQSVVVAATVRNGMAGLPSTMRYVQRLRALFNESWVVIVENESTDLTRSFLYNMTLTDSNMSLLGCGRINSPLPCKTNYRHSTGREHRPGPYHYRSFAEEFERGLMMSALRNMYMDYIYDHLADRATFLLIMDPDISWKEWDLDSITQGLYYFAAKPKLQQLCAHSTFNTHLYDPCTLSFYLNKHFGEDRKYPVVSYEKSVRFAPRSLPPVKVGSCFQAVSFYRMSALAPRRLRYRRILASGYASTTRSPGSWTRCTSTRRCG